MNAEPTSEDTDTPQAEAPEVFSIPRRGPAGEELEPLALSSEKLDSRVRYRLLKSAVLMYRANRRRGTHATKTRSEVAGSGRKLWRQKGTGRARCGSRKNPVWRGGGTIFGPHPRDYSFSMSRKQRRLALRSALFAKFQGGAVLVLDGLELEAPRTKSVATALRALGVGGRCLIGTAGYDRNLVLSARNLPAVKVSSVRDFNAEDVLEARHVILTPDAFREVSEGAPVDSATDASGDANRETES